MAGEKVNVKVTPKKVDVRIPNVSANNTVGEKLGIVNATTIDNVNNSTAEPTRPTVGNTTTTEPDNTNSSSSTRTAFDAATEIPKEGSSDKIIFEEGKPVFNAVIDWAKNHVKAGLMLIAGGGSGYAIKSAFGSDEEKKQVEDDLTKEKSKSGTEVKTTGYTQEEVDAIKNGYIKSLESIASTGQVPMPEAYLNASDEYNKNFKMDKDRAVELFNSANAKSMELAENIYDNSVATFFDRIYQGLGKSNGQTASVMLQNNQKLKSDMSQLMEGSAMLAMSMATKDPKEQFKQRATASRMIMEVISPAMWEKIADNAIKSAAGIASVNMHNAQMKAEMAKSVYAAMTKGDNLDKLSLKDMKDYEKSILHSISAMRKGEYDDASMKYLTDALTKVQSDIAAREGTP
jgi:hypothetical protein